MNATTRKIHSKIAHWDAQLELAERAVTAIRDITTQDPTLAANPYFTETLAKLGTLRDEIQWSLVSELDHAARLGIAPN